MAQTAIRLLAASVLGLTVSLAGAENYPAKPIRVLTAAAGGGLDFAARLVSLAIAGPLGQQVVVDNRGGPFLPGEIVAHALPDGYTLLVGSNNLWLSQFIYATTKMPYDAIKDFSPISMIAKSPSFLVV